MRNWFKGLPKNEKIFLKRLMIILLVFVLISPLLFLVVALVNVRVSPVQAFKVFGYPGVSKNYLLQIRNPWILNSEGGEIKFKANLKFRNGFFTGIDFTNLPEMPLATISLNYTFLRHLNPSFTPTSKSIKKTINNFFLKFWRFDKNAENFIKALEQKDAMISVFNIDNQKIKNADSDFLALTIDNTTNSQSDKYLFKRFSYSVEILPDKEATAILKTYLFYDGFGVYKGKMRAYVPLDVYVLKENVDREETQNNRHVFEKNLEIQPGQAVSAEFRLRLPARMIKDRNYKLFLQKQPSADWEYQISVKVPEDFDIQSDSLEAREFLASRSGVLEKDKIFSVNFKPTTAPLFLSNSYLIKRDEAVLEFNRNLDREEASDGLNYSIEDENAIYPEMTDQVLIKSVSLEDKRVRLEITGMNKQPGEKYLVVARDLKDRYGMKVESEIVRAELIQ